VFHFEEKFMFGVKNNEIYVCVMRVLDGALILLHLHACNDVTYFFPAWGMLSTKDVTSFRNNRLAVT
jgi:hypothetical protein